MGISKIYQTVPLDNLAVKPIGFQVGSCVTMIKLFNVKALIRVQIGEIK